MAVATSTPSSKGADMADWSALWCPRAVNEAVSLGLELRNQSRVLLFMRHSMRSGGATDMDVPLTCLQVGLSIGTLK